MGMNRKTDFCTMKNGQPYIFLNTGYMRLTIDKTVVVTGRYFWNRKCRKITWWQQELFHGILLDFLLCDYYNK